MRFLSHRRAFLSFALAAALLAMMLGCPAATWAQVEVNTCGQEVAGSAVLNADLDCTGFEGYAVTIHGGTLTMNGYTITGGWNGIQCDGPCEIIGPGTVTASTWFGVNAYDTKLRMKNVDVTNNQGFGVQVWRSCILEGPATISGNRVGIRNGAKLTLRNTTVTGNTGLAIEAANNLGTATVDVRDSTITGNGGGIRADRSVKVRDSVITGNAGSGVVVGVLDYIGHGMFECRKGRMSIGDSTITGNGLGADCGVSWACADLESCPKAPRLKGAVACGTSLVNGSGLPGESWHICTLD